MFGDRRHIENAEQFHRALLCDALTTPVFRQAEDRGGGGVFHFFVQRDQHIIQNGQIAEQADVLERAGDTHVVDFDRGLPCRGDAIEQNTPARRLVDIRQEVEDRSFARTVRADQSGDLGRADGDVEIADRGQTAKVNAEMACFKNRAACHIALGQQVGIGLRNQLWMCVIHVQQPPFSIFSQGSAGRSGSKPPPACATARNHSCQAVPSGGRSS